VPEARATGVRGAGVAADLLLEGLEVGAGGGDPVGAEGLVDEVQLVPAHVGGREVEAGRGAHAALLRRTGSVGPRRPPLQLSPGLPASRPMCPL